MVLDSVQDVVMYIEVEILRRTGTGPDAGVPEELPWLFVLASPGTAAESLAKAVQAGAQCLVLGVMLEEWPHGITCSVDADGHITGLDGPDAPAWTGRRLPAATLAQTLAALREGTSAE
jgi:hypothetical protein